MDHLKSYLRTNGRSHVIHVKHYPFGNLIVDSKENAAGSPYRSSTPPFEISRNFSEDPGFTWTETSRKMAG